MATELTIYDQTICTVAATLTAASFGSVGGGTASITVLRYREILSELANGGGLQRGAPVRAARE
jgi:hypothetical protein